MRLCYSCMHQIQDDTLHSCPKCGESLKIENTSTKYLKPGTELQGKFVVGKILGAGGFGNTYIGWNKVLLRKVAIKEFYPEQYCVRAQDGVHVTVQDPNHQKRFQLGLQQFLEEARSVASMQDIKGVVEISNFFEENGTGYIVMEYLEGMDVKHILKLSGNQKDYEWCRRVILTVLHTLRDIHKRGVLHRDIAPDNIFVTKEGIIKLIDFGAAKHASAYANTQREIMLKVGYAPIEQYSRDAKQGPYTDLYAVAALFYRMLTGQKPIPANERVNEDALIPPSDMGIVMPEQAEIALMICLNVQPMYRLQSADEFMEALEGKDFEPVYEPEWILPEIKEPKEGVIEKLVNLSLPAKAAICFGVICLLGALLGGGFFLNRGTNKEEEKVEQSLEEGAYKIIDCKGKQYTEVVKELGNQGLTNITEPSYVYDSHEEGTILTQNPPAGEIVDKNTEISFMISGGETKFTMADLKNVSETEAIRYFTDMNFEVEVIEDPIGLKKHTVAGTNNSLQEKKGCVVLKHSYKNDVQKGIIYDQTMAVGEAYDGSKVITLEASFGAKKDYETKMPDLLGLTKTEVSKKIKSAKLEGVISIKYSDAGYSEEYLDGQVSKQSIRAGQIINTYEDAGELLTVYISKGPKPTPQPTPQTPQQNNSNNTKTKKKTTKKNITKKKTTKKKTTKKKKQQNDNDDDDDVWYIY